jgi:hypothetical protein
VPSHLAIDLESVAEHGPEGAEVWKDLMRVRACGHAAADAGTMGSRARWIAFRECQPEQLTLIWIFEDLRGRGYAGGYDAVRRYAKSMPSNGTQRPPQTLRCAANSDIVPGQLTFFH